MRRSLYVTATVVALVSAASWWDFGQGAADLDDKELAGLWGGRAPATYCNPHPDCSGPVRYCSDAVPGANAGDPCTPHTIRSYYNPEHCTEDPNVVQCGVTSSVTVYCMTEIQCVTAFQGTQKVCIAASASPKGQTLTTDPSRCRNLTLFGASPP